MANKAAIECVDQLLQLLMENSLAFGGKVFLGLGDFRQVAPVVRGSLGDVAAFQSSVRSSYLWPEFRILRLTAPIRTASDPGYSEWIDRIGEGFEKTVSLTMLDRVQSIDEAIAFLFPPEILTDPHAAVHRSFLSPLNKFVDEFNDLMLDRLPGDESQLYKPVYPVCTADWLLIGVYFSYDSIKEDEENIQSDALLEYMGLLRSPGIPDHVLRLKVGTICSLCRNLSVEKGLVKNSRVIVRRLLPMMVEVELLDDSFNREETVFCLPRINFEFQPAFAPWSVQRRQIPLRPAYATTFNSCQGLTLDRIIINLRTPVFAHGQLYTSLSRVRQRDHARLLVSEDNVDATTVNVVYRRLLLPRP
jgi:hypothetical protein